MRCQVAKVRARVCGPSQDGSSSSRWRHQEFSHDGAGRGKSSFGARAHGPSLPWLPVDFFHSPIGPARLSLAGGGCVGCRVPPDACIQVCLDARQAGRLPNYEFARDVERVQSNPVATPARFPRDPFVPAGVPAENDTRRWSYSVHGAKGHERATAVVQPIKVSPWTQHRVDRKRSRREYPTNTGARFTGRALCSSSQRDERRPRRR